MWLEQNLNTSDRKSKKKGCFTVAKGEAHCRKRGASLSHKKIQT